MHLASELGNLLLEFGDLGLGCGAVDRVEGLLRLPMKGWP